MPTSPRRLPIFRVPECTDCGACCFNTHLDYVRVFACDAALLAAEQLDALTVVHDGLRYMRFVDGRCIALSLDAATGRVGCRIYPVRPDVCRSLVRGTGECRSQIEAKWSRREEAFARLRAGDPGPEPES